MERNGMSMNRGRKRNGPCEKMNGKMNMAMQMLAIRHILDLAVFSLASSIFPLMASESALAA